MESSTTRPIATVRPLRVMIFSVISVGKRREINSNTVLSYVSISVCSHDPRVSGTSHIIKRAEKIESGMETAVTIVARQLNLYLPLTWPLKKSKMISVAKTAPKAPSRETPAIDSSIKVACSKTRLVVMLG